MIIMCNTVIIEGLEFIPKMDPGFNELEYKNTDLDIVLESPSKKQTISYMKTIEAGIFIIFGLSCFPASDMPNLDNENYFTYGMAHDLSIESDINEYTNSKFCEEDVITMSINMDSILQSNLEKLQLISKLEYNWNLYGAEPISKDLINIMRNLIYGLKYQPEIFPTGCESIQFEYEKDNGDYLEFELVDEETIEIFRMYSDGTEKYDSCKPNANDINKVVSEFYEQ